MNQFFKNLSITIVSMAVVVSAFAQETMKEYLPVGEYTVTTVSKATGRSFNGNVIKISGDESNEFSGSAYTAYAGIVGSCAKNITISQKIKDGSLSLIFTRPTLKDCGSNEWVIKKTTSGFTAESFPLVDGVRSGDSINTSVITLKR